MTANADADTVSQREIEDRLAELWSETFSSALPAADTNLFDLGADSLDVVRLGAAIEEVFGVRLSIEALFERATLTEQAARIWEATARVGGRGRRRARTERLPVLPNQHAHLLRSRWSEENNVPQPALNVVVPLLFDRALDADAVTAAATALVGRHEALRVTFADGATPTQTVRAAAALPVEIHDRRSVPHCEISSAVARTAGAELVRPFDRTSGPLARISLLDFGEVTGFVLALDHIVADGWSVDVVLRELDALCRARQSGDDPRLPPAPSYARYVAEANSWLESAEAAEQRHWWHAELDGIGPMPAIDFPFRPRPQGHPSFVAATERLDLQPELAGAMHAAAASEGATRFALVATAAQLVLAAYSGRTTLGVLVPVANRGAPSSHGLVGWLANTVVLRGDLSPGLTVEDALEHTSRRIVALLRRGTYPFHALIAELSPREFGRVRRHASAGLAVTASGRKRYKLDGALGEHVPTDDFALHGLRLVARESGEGISLALVYEPEWLSGTIAATVLRDVERALVLVTSGKGTVSDLDHRLELGQADSAWR